MLDDLTAIAKNVIDSATLSETSKGLAVVTTSSLDRLRDALEGSRPTILRHAFITVSGGVAYVAHEPDAVRVHIIDFDDLKCDFGDAFPRLSEEARAFYWQTQDI
jgi:hypothetical protein